MPSEIEIKLRIADEKALRRTFKRLGAKPVGSSPGRVHEQNVIFDTPQGGLAKHGQLLRIRIETPDRTRATTRSKRAKSSPSRTIVTFKQPPASSTHSSSPGRFHHKVREELELEITDSATLTKIFEGLGMSGWFRYEKFRTTFRLPARFTWAKGLLLELDETPIGTYLELEGPPTAIDRAATELGFSKRDYILKNYLVLYVEDCRRRGQQPSHMLFAAAD